MISEAKIRAAFERFSFEEVLAELDANYSEPALDEFVELFIRSNHLFFKYPNLSKERRRDQLFEAVELYFKERGVAEQIKKLTIAVAVLRRTELGYRNLLALLGALPARRRPP